MCILQVISEDSRSATWTLMHACTLQDLPASCQLQRGRRTDPPAAASQKLTWHGAAAAHTLKNTLRFCLPLLSPQPPPGFTGASKLSQLLLCCCYGLPHLCGARQLLQLCELLLQLRLKSKKKKNSTGSSTSSTTSPHACTDM